MTVSWTSHGQLDDVAPVVSRLLGGLPTSTGWLRHAEDLTARRGIEVGYLVASAGGSVVAAVAHYLVDRPEQVSRSYRWSSRRPGGSDDAYPRLLLGAASGHLCQPATASPPDDAGLGLLGSAAAHLASTHPDVPVAALHVPVAGPAVPADVTILSHDALLDVSRFTCLDDYLADLPTRRRQNARREIRTARAAGGWSGRLAEFQPSTWAGLLVEHERRFGRQMSPEHVEADLESLRRSFADGLVAFGFEHGGRLRAVVVGVVHRETLYLRSIGIELAYTRQGLYSAVGYFDPIRWATANGLESIAFGINAARAKCLRGCRHRRLVGCAFDQDGGRMPLTAPRPSPDELAHVATCTRQVRLR